MHFSMHACTRITSNQACQCFMPAITLACRGLLLAPVFAAMHACNRVPVRVVTHTVVCICCNHACSYPATVHAAHDACQLSHLQVQAYFSYFLHLPVPAAMHACNHKYVHLVTHTVACIYCSTALLMAAHPCLESIVSYMPCPIWFCFLHLVGLLRP